MRNELESEANNVVDSEHFWGFGKTLAISCLFQMVLVAFVGFWGVINLSLIAWALVWFCTAYRVVEHSDSQEEWVSQSTTIK